MKFQAFHTSWKNVSCSLGTVNEVLQSTGTCHADSMGATGPAFTTGIQLTSGGELGHVRTQVSHKKKNHINKDEASGDLYLPTLSMTKIKTYASIS